MCTLSRSGSKYERHELRIILNCCVERRRRCRPRVAMNLHKGAGTIPARCDLSGIVIAPDETASRHSGWSQNTSSDEFVECFTCYVFHDVLQIDVAFAGIGPLLAGR